LSLVLDASVAVAWLHEDEGGDAVDAIFDIVSDKGTVVPAHFFLEVANGLTMSLRRGRIDRQTRELGLADLRDLWIEVDPETTERLWNATLALADAYRLTVYDSAYLELARRRGLPLATLDRDLVSAARHEGVALAL
jgi:predicted nucleic acid-binding protein